MKRLFLCLLFTAICAQRSAAATRHYYIAAEDVTWNYAPSGRDLIHDRNVPAPWGNQLSWAKTRFIEYTDASFSVRKPQPEWLGILGPVIRAEVGDTILVDFWNRSHAIRSIHPHGLRYDKANEGAMYLPTGHGSSVAPGGRFTYHWLADEGSGPGADDPNSVVWWYHPDEPIEINAGLLGPIIVTKKGELGADGIPKGIDREFIAMFMIFDEQHGKDTGLFHTINGYIYGNLPGMVMKQGEHVRWYLLGMGNEKDLHTPHWHGKTVQYGKHHTDVVELLPGSMTSVDMVADNPGTWMLHCHVADHMESGMMVTYTIYQPPVEPCPIEIAAAEFWGTSGKFTLRIKNGAAKPIKSVWFMAGTFNSPLDLHPASIDWNWTQTLQPGQEQTIEREDNFRKSAAIAGWAIYPQNVLYQDGSRWTPTTRGDCFKVFWRDPNLPQPVVLPPLQMELNED
jgi:FtsP/CotA-like multicopper oxidase with cupredoxin domain